MVHLIQLILPYLNFQSSIVLLITSALLFMQRAQTCLPSAPRMPTSSYLYRLYKTITAICDTSNMTSDDTSIHIFLLEYLYVQYLSAFFLFTSLYVNFFKLQLIISFFRLPFPRKYCFLRYWFRHVYQVAVKRLQTLHTLHRGLLLIVSPNSRGNLVYTSIFTYYLTSSDALTRRAVCSLIPEPCTSAANFLKILHQGR